MQLGEVIIVLHPEHAHGGVVPEAVPALEFVMGFTP